MDPEAEGGTAELSPSLSARSTSQTPRARSGDDRTSPADGAGAVPASPPAQHQWGSEGDQGHASRGTAFFAEIKGQFLCLEEIRRGRQCRQPANPSLSQHRRAGMLH